MPDTAFASESHFTDQDGNQYLIRMIVHQPLSMEIFFKIVRHVVEYSRRTGDDESTFIGPHDTSVQYVRQRAEEL